MKVFISWSGQRSAAVADALRYWLPKVIQALEPWMSADDIEKGTRWRSGLASELEKSSVGIICLTRENLASTWIHFEAGALSKQQENTYVCTLLFGLEYTDVREPLAQFQHTRATKDDLRKLISTINTSLGDSKLPESELSESFEVWWPKLEERLARIDEIAANNQPIRNDRELLEEILEVVRTQARVAVSSVSSSLSPSVRVRLPSTLDWSPEDAQIISDHWANILADAPNMAERDYAEQIRTFEPAALAALQQIKTAREVRKMREARRILKDAYDADIPSKAEPNENTNS